MDALSPAPAPPAAPAGPPPRLYANRVRVYPKAVTGPVRRLKWAILVLCLGVYYLLPWLRWPRGPGLPDQAILLDLWDERFYFFGLELWPQDVWFLAGLLALGAVGLFLVTSLFGRLWCGFACPQTVWTDLFLLVERRIEGDRNERMRRDRGPWTADRVLRKTVKHAVWLGVAFWTGGAWVMYYVDAPTLVREFWTARASGAVYAFTGLFTATTYLLAGWAREQVCTYMCPWPRFQSAMLDENTFIVTYEAWRGEPRGRGAPERRTALGLGDCVDCRACVHVCPTGIDIRDGVQLECINCGLCIDACNHVMEKTGRPRFLITWDTLARQAARAAGERPPLRLLRPRTLIYLTVLLGGTAVLGAGLALRARQGLEVAHDRAPLFVRLASGDLRNGYQIEILNKSLSPATFSLSAAGIPNPRLRLADALEAKPAAAVRIEVPRDTAVSRRVLVDGAFETVPGGRSPLVFTLRNEASGEVSRYQSVFLGPAAPTAAEGAAK